MQQSLRPATRCVHDHLLALGDAARGRSMGELADELDLAIRTVRRALGELEEARLVVCARRSTREKVVRAVTNYMSGQAAQNGPKRPKTAQAKTAQNGPKRPKPSAPLSLLGNYVVREAVAVDVTLPRAREASADFEQQQQRQQLLDLGVSDDRDRAAVRAMLRRLDEAVRDVWRRVGSTHGYLALDEASLGGLGVAMRRYPAVEIVDCVVWSAERLAAGALSPQYFATTFRGNGFCARHRAWQDERRAAERRQREEAAIAADVHAHHGPPRTELTKAELGQRGLEALERLAAGAPP